MRRLKRFARLSSAERRLLYRAWLTVAAVRTGLWLLPLDLVRRMKLHARQNPRCAADRIIWSVITAARYFPHATCLTQAIAAQALLSRSGHVSRIEIGVTKDRTSRFEAHAWLVCNGRIVLGGRESIRYTPLLALEEGA
jgi:hypothetical protein